MILILCNSYDEYKKYLKGVNFDDIRNRNYVYAYESSHVEQFISMKLKEIRIISQVTWFTFQEYFNLTRRIRG